MYGIGSKKMLNIMILEILRKYTDENHSLTQQEVLKLLDKNYGMECDRRSVRNNILSLKAMGYDISMEDGYRLLSREFDDAELRILIDSVLFSKSISTRQAKSIINKLRDMSSNYFNAKVSHVCNLPDFNRTDNKQAMYTLDAINDAISDKKKISFIYNEVGVDLKLHPKRQEPYIVNPYQIVANNGRFYLVGNYDKYDNVAHFRIDKMTNVTELDDNAKPMKNIPELADGLNLPKHMAEHIYMFSGKSSVIKFTIFENMLSSVVDWFGKDFNILKQEDEILTIRLKCNEQAMCYWALQYGPYVEVLEPKSLRSQLKDDILNMYKKYQD